MCPTARGEALFSSYDALLCTDGSARALVDLACAPGCAGGEGLLEVGSPRRRSRGARTKRAAADRTALGRATERTVRRAVRKGEAEVAAPGPALLRVLPQHLPVRRP